MNKSYSQYQQLQNECEKLGDDLSMISAQIQHDEKVVKQIDSLGLGTINAPLNNINYVQEEKNVISDIDNESDSRSQMSEILHEQDGKIYFLTRRKGIIFDTKYWMQVNNITYNVQDIEDDEVKNKIINRIVQFDQIDIKNFKSLISFASREMPDKDITTHIIPMIAFCLQSALETEMKIQITMRTTLMRQLNFFKTSNNLEIKDKRETSVFSRIKNYLLELYGSVADYFSNNVDIEIGNYNKKQFADGKYNPQYFQ
jgi:hypothetical protein